MKAFLILEDGNVFEGESIGSISDSICEIVFNTSMSGYVEVLTDPSYAGQGVVMTYPLIGNYGTCGEDYESAKPWVSAFIVRELSRVASNFRNEEDLNSYLKRNNIPGIQGIDTRSLTRILREKGTMNGMITCNELYVSGGGINKCFEMIKAFRQDGLVEKVSGGKKITGCEGFNIALMDYGAKNSISKKLAKRGMRVTSYNCLTTAEEILRDKPDGILLSNGPGDPADCVEIIKNARKLYESDVPIFAICLGHQLMALAAGAKTKKLKYGHRGVNHPVRDLRTGRVYITSQNHGYVVDADTLDPAVGEISHINVNDKTVEGVRYKGKNIFTVQFHPEAAGGPWDTEYLFDEFIQMIGGNKNA